MTEEPDLEARVTAVEQRLDVVAADAAAARHLAAANDRDYADIVVKLDALRSTLNAHAVQTAGGFAEVRAHLARHDAIFARHDATFARHDESFARLAAGQQQIVDLLNTVIAGQGEQ